MSRARQATEVAGANEAAQEPAADSTHEALLRRHGLITHVAVLPVGASNADIARFQSDAARRARNLIVLGPRRFGVSLGDPTPPLSSIAHVLLPEVEDRRDGAERPAEPGDAALPNPVAETSAEPVHPVSKGGAAAADADADGAHAFPDPSTEHLAARLDEVEDRLGGFDAQGIVALALPALDDLVSHRLDRLEGNLIAWLAPLADSAEALPNDRIAAFWEGLEQALRLLHGQLAELGGVTDRLKAYDPPDIATGLDELEQTVALGFEAAGEAREAHQASLEARIIEQESGRRTALASIENAIARLADETAAISAAIADRQGQPDRDDELSAAIGNLGDRIVSLVDERVPEGDIGALAARLDRFGLQVQEVTDATARIDARLDPDDDSHSSVEMADRIAALDAQVSRLAERLEARGGVLSDALDTAHRSMKNFWLAAEDTLGRLNTALARLEPPEEPADFAEQGDAFNADDPLGTIAARLDAIESRLDSGERDGARLRVALAELLARTARSDGTLPDRPTCAR